MADISTNNKRIAKNTIFLYIRMLATLLVGLYTSRIVLKALGVEDYGVYSLLAGVVSLLSYVNTLLNQGTSRFLTIELGKGENGDLHMLFKSCLTLHVIISLFTFVVGEIVGLWYVNNELNIEPGRLFAANVVFQCGLLSSVLTLIQAPFQASIISHEKMDIYAYMSIYDVVMKLLVAFSLLYSTTDNLILYAILNLAVSMSGMFIYNIYCRRLFSECRFSIGIEKNTIKEIGGFIRWNAVESFSWMMNSQGFNILLNKFFSTVVNAAVGLIQYISGAICMFVMNFQTSSRPQIFKYYAQGELNQMNNLVSNTSRYSSYIMMIMSIPVLVETGFVYKIWLGEVPEYTVPFLRLTIIQMFFFSIDKPLTDGIKAVGRLKSINIITAGIYTAFIGLWFLCLKMGITPVGAFALYCVQTPILLCVNLYFLSRFTSIGKRIFFKSVIFKSLAIFVISIILPVILHFNMDEGWWRFIAVGTISVLVSFASVFYMGLDAVTRKTIVNYVLDKINKSRI